MDLDIEDIGGSTVVRLCYRCKFSGAALTLIVVQTFKDIKARRYQTTMQYNVLIQSTLYLRKRITIINPLMRKLFFHTNKPMNMPKYKHAHTAMPSRGKGREPCGGAQGVVRGLMPCSRPEGLSYT